MTTHDTETEAERLARNETTDMNALLRAASIRPLWDPFKPKPDTEPDTENTDPKEAA